MQALKVLKDVPGVGMVEFGKKDIVRHQLVQRIVEAYQQWDDRQKLTENQNNKNNEND